MKPPRGAMGYPRRRGRFPPLPAALPRWSCPCPSFPPPKRSRRGDWRSPTPKKVPVPRRPRDGFFLRAESFYNVATEIDRLDEIAPLKGAYGGRSLHEQSHGESFLALVLNRFSGSGLCTCWTNRRPLFRPRVSLRFWLLWTDWSAKIPSFSSPPIPRCFWRIRTPKFLF